MPIALPAAVRRHWAVNASVVAHAAAITGLLLFRAGSTTAPVPIATTLPQLAIDLSAPLQEEPRDEAKPAEPRAEVAPAVPSPSPLPPSQEEMAAEPPPPEPQVAAPIEPEPQPVTSAAVDAVPIPAPPKPQPRPSPPKPLWRPSPPRTVATAHPEPPPPPSAAVNREPSPAAAAVPAPDPSTAVQAAARTVDPAPSGPPPDYLALLRAKLQRAMEYPRSARMQGIQGQAVLWLLIDREGRVQQYRIVRSSGYEVLDREAEAMARKASPLPPMPAAMTERELAIQLPVSFSLR